MKKIFKKIIVKQNYFYKNKKYKDYIYYHITNKKICFDGDTLK